MRQIIHSELVRGRVRNGLFGTTDADGLQGAFFVYGPCGADLKIIACDGTDKEALGWEHVSVSLQNRTPNWKEMCCVKDLFWEEEEVVIQFHPAKSSYINNHPNCLHLWKCRGSEFKPLPPEILIGVKASEKDSLVVPQSQPLPQEP